MSIGSIKYSVMSQCQNYTDFEFPTFLESPIFSLTSVMKVCRIISMSNVRYYFNVEMIRYVNIGGNMTPSLLTPLNMNAKVVVL